MKHKTLTAVIASVLILCIASSCAISDKDSASSALSGVAIRQAVYPTRTKAPNYMDYENGNAEPDYSAYDAAELKWREERKARTLPENVDLQGMYSFVAGASEQILGKEATENLLYSPINVYLALCMLAEVTSGNSQKQVLDLLGETSTENLRETASALWNAVYCDDGRTKTYLGSSLWLNENISFKQNVINTLAEVYYASSYRGEMGSEEMDKALQSWLNENTGGLLKDQISDVKLSPETVVAIATTVYFGAKWTDEFRSANTIDGIFHSTNGDKDCRFMTSKRNQSYYYADGFAAVNKSMSEGEAKMWLILPDEGVTPQSLIASGKVNGLVCGNTAGVDSTNIIVNLRMPKFDVESKTDLKEDLQALGLTDVFQADKADFSALTDDTYAFITNVEHGVRVMVDEEGCQAAAYTLMPAAGAAPPPPNEVDFFLDRPFIFAITNRQNIPLFIGIVNQP